MSQENMSQTSIFSLLSNLFIILCILFSKVEAEARAESLKLFKAI